MSEDTFHWVVTGAVAISTLCIFIMAAVAIALYRTVSKVQVKVDDVSYRVEPVIDSVRGLTDTVRRLTDENAPRFSDVALSLRDIAANAKDVSEVAKDQAHRFAEVGRDIADRTQVQVARVEAVMDQTVGQVQEAGENVKEAVLKPVREASGLIAGVRAAVTTFAQGQRTSVNRSTQDEEMFI